MKIKLDTGSVRLGMFVAELDRPWLESPFLFQGFLLDDPGDLDQLRDICCHVFVDDLRSSQDPAIQDVLRGAMGGLRSGRVNRINVEFEEWKGAARLRQTLARLKDATTQTRERMQEVLDDVEQGRAIETQRTREVVSDLVARVTRNPHTAQWITLLKAKDQEIAQHCINVSVLAAMLARELGWSDSLVNIVSEAAMLHDAGMSRVPEWIRSKPGPLTQREFQLVKMHPAYTARLLGEAGGYDERIIDIVRHHHERNDGSGYPDALVGHEIADYVQVVAIADVYESMTTEKPYEPALAPSVALTRLHSRARNHFSRLLVEAFIRALGIYPLSSLVRLRNGAIGIVVSSQEENRLKPVLLLVRDEKGQKVWPRRMVNLALFEGDRYADWKIDTIIDPDEIGLDVRQVLIEEFMLR
ncbi:MAG: HD-GYP domain-containing protein [Gammaproteobacteria bacterium]|nr:HD-GYP domain-containing protein [Gammaproteobacteria bacterium]